MNVALRDYFYLCGHCGEITPVEKWAMFHYTEDGERRPHEQRDSDPVCECPVCTYEHTDDDGGAAVWDGHSFEEIEAQRDELLLEVDEPHGADYMQKPGPRRTPTVRDVRQPIAGPWPDAERGYSRRLRRAEFGERPAEHGAPA